MVAAINFPAGVKMRGENILSIYPSGNALDWSLFPTTWPDLKKAITYAYGIGCNVVRMVGDMGFIHSGAINQATYDSYWSTFLDFTDSLGLYCYPCMQGGDQIAPESLTIPEMTTSIRATLLSMATRTKIVAIDLVNEGNNGGLSTGDAGTLLSGVRSGGTAFALTCSTYEPFVTQPGWYNAVEPFTDFSDFHVYRSGWGTAPTQSDITNGPFTWWGSKDLMFGEFGDPKSEGTTNNSAWLNACITALNVPDSAGCHAWGGAHWNIYDQDPSAATQYGSFAITTWAPYTPYIFPLANASGTAAAPSAPATLTTTPTNIALVNPIACTTDYAGVKILLNGSQVSNTSWGYYDNSASTSRGRYTYTGKVTTGSHGDSSVSTGTTYMIGPANAIPNLQFPLGGLNVG